MLSNHLSEKDIWIVAPYMAAKTRCELFKSSPSKKLHQDDFEQLVTSYNWISSEISASYEELTTYVSTIHEELHHLLIQYVIVLQDELRKRGLSKDLLSWCNNAIESCNQIEFDNSNILLIRSDAHTDLGNWKNSLDDINNAISKSKDSDKAIYARTLYNLGRIKRNQGDYVEAYKILLMSENLLLEQNDYKWASKVKLEIATYCLDNRNLDKAIRFFLEAAELASSIEEDDVYYNSQLLLGVIYRKKRNYDRAIFYFKNILSQQYLNLNKRLYATTVHHLSWVYLNQGDVFSSKKYCIKSIEYYEDVGDTRGLSDAYEQLGLIYLAEKDNVNSLKYLEESLVIRQEIGNKHGTASSLRHLGISHFHEGHIYKSLVYLWKSFRLYKDIGVLTSERFTRTLWEIIDWTLGKRQWTM